MPPDAALLKRSAKWAADKAGRMYNLEDQIFKALSLGAPYVKFRIPEPCAALATLTEPIVLEELDCLPALGTWHFIDIFRLPQLSILTWTFHFLLDSMHTGVASPRPITIPPPSALS